MKRQSILFNIIGALLCTISANATASDLCNPGSTNCCEWSCFDGKMTFGADWIYWKVTEDRLRPYQVIETDSDVAANTFDAHLRSAHPRFKFTNGFKVNLGYEMPCDCWGVNINYTYLPSRASFRSFNGDGAATTQILPNFTDFPVLATALTAFGSPTNIATKWDLTSNNIDVDIGRTLCFGECIKLRPHIGFRAAWFDQRLRFHTDTLLTNFDGSVIDSHLDSTWKESFKGYGVEGGLWGEWQIGYGLSFVGHFGGSILYSKIRTHEHLFLSATTTAIPGGPAPVTAVSRSCGSDTIWTATPMMDYFVGIQYADCLCDMPFSAHLGWEQHVLFDVNRLARDGNLAAQGLTLGFEFGF